MSEHEVINQIDLLDNKGCIIEEGWARHPVWKYNRKKIKASKLAIKEWDYYAILNPVKEYAIALTFSDLGFASLYALSFIDYRKKASAQSDAIKLLTLHKTGLQSSSLEDSYLTISKEDRFTFSVVTKENKIAIVISAPHLILPDGTKGLYLDALLARPDEKESINIATSWKENRKAFYLNEKVVGIEFLKGKVRRGDKIDDLPSEQAIAILDWGRGRWTRENTWYWASGAGYNERGDLIGLNLGYGFTDRTPASENALFINDKLYKIGKLEFFTSEDLSDEWRIKDEEGSIDLTFTPVAPRLSKTDLKLIVSDQKQYFGYFNGKIHTEEGFDVEITHLQGFAEQVFNKW